MTAQTIYVDIWLVRLLANFIFDYLLLWATASVVKHPSTAKRLVLAASVGTSHYLLYSLASLGVIPYYGLLRFFPSVVLVSLIMIAIAFFPVKRTRALRLLGCFYGIGFLSAGAGLAASYVAGQPYAPAYTVGMIVACATILVIGEIGWGIVQRSVAAHVYQLPLEIRWGQRSVRIQALVDSGNRIRDPLTRQPVIIVEQEALAPMLPDSLQNLITDNGDLDDVVMGDETRDYPWTSRIKLIPYSSIGREKGLLVGFRPDSIELVAGEQFHFADKIVIAIYPKSLDPDGAFQALVPPELLFRETAPKGGSTHAMENNS